MSEHQEFVGTHPGRTLFSAKASALAGFTIAVASLIGRGGWTDLPTALKGYGAVPVLTYLDIVEIATIVVAGLGIALGWRANLQAEGDTWEANLGRASVLVGGLAAILAVLTLAASHLH